MEESLSYIVVLNYETFEETIECVESIQNLDYSKCRVLIIDNGSSNDSYAILKNKYFDDCRVEVMNTGKNLGFSRGFNYGVRVAKRRGAEHVAVTNNDVVFVDSSVLKKCNEIAHQQPECVVIGPKIVSPEGIRVKQNPYIPSRPSSLKVMTMGLSCRHWSLYRLYRIYMRLKNLLTSPTEAYIIGEQQAIESRAKVYALHGSFLFFTKNFFRYFDLPFDERVFLTGEEDILGEMVYKRSENIYMYYYPEVEIFHKEHLTQKTVSADRKDLTEFQRNYMLNSRKIYREYYFSK